jgi:hypothetical protein
MKTAQLTRRIVPLGLLVSLALPWSATAQTKPASSEPAAASRAGDEAWFREYIEPFKLSLREETAEQNPVLYDPNEAAPMPGRPAPERRVYRHEAEVGTVGVVALAGDLPPTRSEWIDARGWNEWNAPLRPEMLRVYFERVAPPAPLRPVVQ